MERCRSLPQHYNRRERAAFEDWMPVMAMWKDGSDADIKRDYGSADYRRSLAAIQ
jgi:hypothetical protein